MNQIQQCPAGQQTTTFISNFLESLYQVEQGSFKGESLILSIQDFLITNKLPVREVVDFYILYRDSAVGYIVDSFQGCTSFVYQVDGTTIERLLSILSKTI